MIAFYVIFAVLVLVLYLLTQVRDRAAEHFVDMASMDIASVTEAAKKLAEAPAMSLEGMPTPPELFKKARELMAKYDQPDLWIHAARVMDKDPGQLARMNLGIE
jgi:hypothetical protein